MKTTRLAPEPCLSCGALLDAASNLEDRKPKPGSVSFCLYCKHIAAYDNQLKLRELTIDELIEVAKDPRMGFAARLSQKFNQYLAGKNAGKSDDPEREKGGKT